MLFDEITQTIELLHYYHSQLPLQKITTTKEIRGYVGLLNRIADSAEYLTKTATLQAESLATKLSN